MTTNALLVNRKSLPELAMRRTTNRHLCGLIVEGISDRKFFEKFVAPNSCAVFPVGGKPEVVATVQEAATSRLAGVLGVIDGDFDYFFAKPKPSGDVFRTDTTDVESLMFSSPAFIHLFREAALRDGDLRSSESIARLAEANRSLVSAAAFQIGLIRCAAAQAGMNIRFKDLNYNSFVNHLTCVVDVQACMQAVLALPRSTIDDDTAKKIIEAALEEHAAHNVWEVVRGHDLTRVAAICSETRFGRRLDHTEVERGLRLAYDAEELRKTALYADVQLWAERNAPFTVWKPTAIKTGEPVASAQARS